MIENVRNKLQHNNLYWDSRCLFYVKKSTYGLRASTGSAQKLFSIAYTLGVNEVCKGLGTCQVLHKKPFHTHIFNIHKMMLAFWLGHWFRICLRKSTFLWMVKFKASIFYIIHSIYQIFINHYVSGNTIHFSYSKISSLLILHSAKNCIHFLPLYPGTHFPACPGGGVFELPNPMHEAVIGDPVSGKEIQCVT